MAGYRRRRCEFRISPNSGLIKTAPLSTSGPASVLTPGRVNRRLKGLGYCSRSRKSVMLFETRCVLRRSASIDAGPAAEVHLEPARDSPLFAHLSWHIMEVRNGQCLWLESESDAKRQRHLDPFKLRQLSPGKQYHENFRLGHVARRHQRRQRGHLHQERCA